MNRTPINYRVPILDPSRAFDWQEREDSGLVVAVAKGRRAEPLRAERFDLALPVGNDHVKVLQVVWPKNEVGLYVSSPYLVPRHSIVGRAILRQPPGGTGQMDLKEYGKVSRSAVKLSFHQSGQVRISATGKVRPTPIDRTPLTGLIGHLFTVHVRGLSAFEAVTVQDRQRRPGRQMVVDLPVPVALGPAAAIKLVGRWYPRGIVGLDRLDLDGPPEVGRASIELTPGVLTLGVLLAPPLDWPGRDYCLFVTYSPFDDAEGLADPYALLLGGMGPHSEPDVADAGLSMLAIMTRNRRAEMDELERLLGTVDLVPEADREPPATA